jgi:hypothetical protein
MVRAEEEKAVRMTQNPYPSDSRVVDGESCLWNETLTSGAWRDTVLKVVREYGHTSSERWGCDLYASRTSRICDKYFCIGRKPTAQKIRETGERALWAFPTLRPQFSDEASAYDAVKLMTELYNDRQAVWEVAALVVPVPPYLQQHDWDEAATKDDTGWVSSLKRDPHVSGVLLAGPVELARVTRGRNSQPERKLYQRELAVIVFTRKQRAETLPWLHRVEPVREMEGGCVLVQGPCSSVESILQRAKLQHHPGLCRGQVRAGVTAAHLYAPTEEETERFIVAADADVRHQLDVVQPEALDTKSTEQLALFCFSDRAPAAHSLTHRVRNVLNVIDIDPRRIMHCTPWAVEAPLLKSDITKLTERYGEWSRTGLRMKVAGEWVTKPVHRANLEVHNMPMCSAAAAIERLRKVGINGTHVTRATRVIRNAPAKKALTWNVEVHGLRQDDFAALRGRVHLRLENGPLVDLVVIEQPRDINSVLRQPSRPWGGRRCTD